MLSQLGTMANSEALNQPKKFRLVLTIPHGKEWFELPSYLKLSKYRISPSGKMRNIHGRIINPWRREDGYVCVNIWNDDRKARTWLLHRLVALAFIPCPCKNRNKVDHINRIRDDNEVGNLRWVTWRENSLNSTPHGSPSRKIVQQTLDGKVVKIWNSSSDVSQALGVSKRHVSHVCQKQGNCQGYQWNYYYEKIDGEVWVDLELDMDVIIGVSSCGRIRHLMGAITYGNKSPSGYYRVQINKRGHQVHRLICRAFMPHPEYTNLTVNHKDRNKGNNVISNLEWSTQSEQMQHVVATSNWKNRKTGARRVRQMTLQGGTITEFTSVTEASEVTNVNLGSISRTCLGKQDTAGGFLWRYIDSLVDHKRNFVTKYDNRPKAPRKVRQITLKGEVIGEFSSVSEASRITKVDRRSIGKTCLGRQNTSGGYLWEYI